MNLCGYVFIIERKSLHIYHMITLFQLLFDFKLISVYYFPVFLEIILA